MVNFHKALDAINRRKELLSLPIRVAGTGHRPDKLFGYDPPQKVVAKFITKIKVELLRLNTDLVISGGALGFDQYIALAALDLEIPLLLALPHANFARNWPRNSRGRETHALLMAFASYVHTVTPGDYEEHGPKCLQWRNEWMVDHCTHLVAFHNGTLGGTHNCLEYANARPHLQGRIFNLHD